MNPGDLVRLKGSTWSSYERQGEIGLVIETNISHSVQGFDTEFSRIMWSKESVRGNISVVRTDHLEIII